MSRPDEPTEPPPGPAAPSDLAAPTFRSARTVRVRMTRQDLIQTRDEQRELATALEHRFSPEEINALADKARKPADDVSATQATVPLLLKR